MPIQSLSILILSQFDGSAIKSCSDIGRPRAAILYATDAGFALPTIASALQMQRLCPTNVADIRIVVNNMPRESFVKLRDYLEPTGIFVDSMPASLLKDFDINSYNKTHVPPSTLARFFLLECVPVNYDRILYLDGDTWALENPSSLIAAPLLPGMFAAAEDKSYYHQAEIGRHGKWVQNYFSGIGIDGKKGYFNAGVLLADTTTWRELSRDAYSFFKANTGLCLYHDQSALNAVATDRRLRLAPRWNFLNAYYEWGLKIDCPPCIVHFAGGAKPWEHASHSFAKTYEVALAPLSDLPFGIKRATPESQKDHIRYQRQLHLKMETIFRHRRYRRQKLFDALIHSAAIP